MAVSAARNSVVGAAVITCSRRSHNSRHLCATSPAATAGSVVLTQAVDINPRSAAARPLLSSAYWMEKEEDTEDTSGQFQLVPLDLNCQRALDRLNRDHQFFAFVVQKHSF